MFVNSGVALQGYSTRRLRRRTARRIVLSFAPSAATVWHCCHVKATCGSNSARQNVFVKRWERPPPSAPFVLDSAPLLFFVFCYVGAWYRKRGTGRNPCGSRTVPLFCLLYVGACATTGIPTSSPFLVDFPLLSCLVLSFPFPFFCPPFPLFSVASFPSLSLFHPYFLWVFSFLAYCFCLARFVKKKYR